MIFVIGFSCLSRGPDDQGLSCGPRVIIVRERPAGGGSKRLEIRRDGEEERRPRDERTAHWRRELWHGQRLKRGHAAPARPAVRVRSAEKSSGGLRASAAGQLG